MLTKTKMLNRIKAVTEGLRCSNPKELDPTLAELVSKVKNHNGINVVQLISYLTKVDLNHYLNSVGQRKLKPLACYVNTVLYNSYQQGTIIVVDSSGKPIGPAGVPTSHIPTELKLGTVEDINKLTEAQIKYMINDYSGC